MAGSETGQMAPAVAGELETLGWHAGDPEVREVVPAVLRGTSAVVHLPPAPAWASPLAAALLAGLAERPGRVLVLAAPVLINEWALVFTALARGTALRIEAARGPARAARTLAAGDVDVLIASPATALALHGRSALAPDRITTLVLAWPETWDSDAGLAGIAPDLPRDAQRLLITARPDLLGGSDGLIERYLRKALVLGGSAAGEPAGPVRTMATPWHSRAGTVATLIEALDPPAVTVWTADTRDHATLAQTLGRGGDTVTIVARATPAAGTTTICY
ncbi:MAG TPA: hypothetical protein VHW65_08385, partial [Gemmatimonadales bacterium]|nr:hypothetical protein [Gemmatimonadales bacterium]